jgi:hypothetical protein
LAFGEKPIAKAQGASFRLYKTLPRLTDSLRHIFENGVHICIDMDVRAAYRTRKRSNDPGEPSRSTRRFK